jgi:hypothetical protein
MSTETKQNQNWISVKASPLFTIINDQRWECTEAGEKEFLAAIRLNNDEWWIKHCVIEDQVGLMVVGETDNEPAGFDLSDIEFYSHITPPSL